MQATMRAVRVFGSNSDQRVPADLPVWAEGFPDVGDIVKVFVGPIPDYLRTEIAIERVTPVAVFERTFRGQPGGDSAIRKLVADGLGVIEDRSWYSTYVIERPVEVPVTPEQPDSEHLWLDWREFSDTEKQLRRTMCDALDAVVAYTVDTVGHVYFEDLLIPLSLYYVALDGRCTAWPLQMKFGGSASISSPDVFSTVRLQQRLEGLGALGGGIDGTVNAKVRHWHALALSQRDQWQRFMSAWTGLEILARTEGAKWLLKHRDRTDLGEQATRAFAYDRGRKPPIGALFAAFLVEVRPAEVEVSVSTFDGIRKVRDAMVHGEPIAADALPASVTVHLLTSSIEFLAAHSVDVTRPPQAR